MSNNYVRGLVFILSLLPWIASCSNTPGISEEEEGTCDITFLPYNDPLTQTGAIGAHDPVIIKQDDTYYVFMTGIGIPIRQSTDMIQWTDGGEVFPDLPAWVNSSVPGVNFPWAPDISFFNGSYHLYYALSTWGSARSVIALATNKTLDPADPEYNWVDRGPVVESTPGVTNYNAIDPNVAFDEDSTPWLSWGSYWTGIKMRRLDRATGKLSATDEVIHSIARRPAKTAIEAPFIIKKGSFYYLFVSFDRCCNGVKSTYKIMVGRSDTITGPYVDRQGKGMMVGGGTLVIKTYGRIRGPGHNAVFSEAGKYYLVHHFYDGEGGGAPKLQIRSLLWDEDGWPLAGEPFDGSYPIDPDAPAPDVTGKWSYLVDPGPPVEIELTSDGILKFCDRGGTWSQDGQSLTLRWTALEPSKEDRIENLIVSSDGSWFVGRTDSGGMIRGARTGLIK
jgi:arabinan endo-1,5-alpha-L-arabinosidase